MKDIKVIFRVRKGNSDDYYDTVRYIVVKRNEDFNPVNSELFIKLKANSEVSEDSESKINLTVSDIM